VDILGVDFELGQLTVRTETGEEISNVMFGNLRLVTPVEVNTGVAIFGMILCAISVIIAVNIASMCIGK
jgi:hypothetical protein